jgi:hypothetical protein
LPVTAAYSQRGHHPVTDTEIRGFSAGLRYYARDLEAQAEGERGRELVLARDYQLVSEVDTRGVYRDPVSPGTGDSRSISSTTSVRVSPYFLQSTALM